MKFASITFRKIVLKPFKTKPLIVIGKDVRGIAIRITGNVSVIYNKNRSSHRKRSARKGFLEILQNSQENTCARVSFLN